MRSTNSRAWAGACCGDSARGFEENSARTTSMMPPIHAPVLSDANPSNLMVIVGGLEARGLLARTCLSHTLSHRPRGDFRSRPKSQFRQDVVDMDAAVPGD